MSAVSPKRASPLTLAMNACSVGGTLTFNRKTGKSNGDQIFCFISEGKVHDVGEKFIQIFAEKLQERFRSTATVNVTNKCGYIDSDQSKSPSQEIISYSVKVFPAVKR
jgi:hypothetical protein